MRPQITEETWQQVEIDDAALSEVVETVSYDAAAWWTGIKPATLRKHASRHLFGTEPHRGKRHGPVFHEFVKWHEGRRPVGRPNYTSLSDDQLRAAVGHLCEVDPTAAVDWCDQLAEQASNVRTDCTYIDGDSCEQCKQEVATAKVYGWRVHHVVPFEANVLDAIQGRAVSGRRRTRP